MGLERCNRQPKPARRVEVPCPNCGTQHEVFITYEHFVTVALFCGACLHTWSAKKDTVAGERTN